MAIRSLLQLPARFLHMCVRCPACESRSGGPPYGLCTACQTFLHEQLRTAPAVERDPLFIAPYAGPWERLVHALKYQRFELVAQFFAAELAAYIRRLGLTPRPITWVPTTRQRRMARGYDQAERIAFYLARELGVPRIACLQRRDQSRSLAALPSRAHRSRADAGFVPLAHSQQGSVWLVDDVITTGTTLRTVERLLQQSGVEVERRITAVKAFSRPGSRSEYQGSDEANDGAYKDLRIRMTEEGF